MRGVQDWPQAPPGEVAKCGRWIQHTDWHLSVTQMCGLRHERRTEGGKACNQPTTQSEEHRPTLEVKRRPVSSSTHTPPRPPPPAAAMLQAGHGPVREYAICPSQKDRRQGSKTNVKGAPPPMPPAVIEECRCRHAAQELCTCHVLGRGQRGQNDSPARTVQSRPPPPLA